MRPGLPPQPQPQPPPRPGPFCVCSASALTRAPRPPSPPPRPPACRPGTDAHLADQAAARSPGLHCPPQVIIHRLLSMFHPRPFVKTRFAPQGAVACLTAVSDFYYTVMFRCVALDSPQAPQPLRGPRGAWEGACLEAPRATAYHPLGSGKPCWLSGPPFPRLWRGWR